MIKLNNTLFNISDDLDIITNKLLNAFKEIFPFVTEADEYFNIILIRLINTHKHILLFDNNMELFLNLIVKDVSKEIKDKEFMFKILEINENLYLLSLCIYP